MTYPLSVVFAATLLLAGCAEFSREQALPAAATTDDDAICQKAGPAGSPAYVSCRKDRDVVSARSSSNAGIERAHKGLAEDMLNGR